MTREPAGEADSGDRFSPLDRLALDVTTKVGSPGFFLIVFAWTVLWLGWNLLAPDHWRFDPGPTFVLWLFVSNMIQILLTPLIMVGQNLLDRRSEQRAENDFEINRKAEEEVEAILLRLEQQQALLARQEALAVEILGRMRTPNDPIASSCADPDRPSRPRTPAQLGWSGGAAAQGKPRRRTRQ